MLGRVWLGSALGFGVMVGEDVDEGTGTGIIAGGTNIGDNLDVEGDTVITSGSFVSGTGDWLGVFAASLFCPDTLRGASALGAGVGIGLRGCELVALTPKFAGVSSSGVALAPATGLTCIGGFIVTGRGEPRAGIAPGVIIGAGGRPGMVGEAIGGDTEGADTCVGPEMAPGVGIEGATGLGPDVSPCGGIGTEAGGAGRGVDPGGGITTGLIAGNVGVITGLVALGRGTSGLFVALSKGTEGGRGV